MLVDLNINQIDLIAVMINHYLDEFTAGDEEEYNELKKAHEKLVIAYNQLICQGGK